MNSSCISMRYRIAQAGGSAAVGAGFLLRQRSDATDSAVADLDASAEHRRDAFEEARPVIGMQRTGGAEDRIELRIGEFDHG